MAAGEIHVKLSVDFADDPQMRALSRFGRESRSARDLYVQMVCYCKRNLTDGLVPDEQIGLLVYPDPPRVGHRDAAHLLDVGVLQRLDGAYLVRSYLKRNKSRAQVRQESQEKHDEAVLGNHKRWHEGRGITSPDCPHCDPDPNRVGDRVPDRGGESTETETETETDASDRGTDHRAGFDEFWNAYPRKVGKGSARKAWAKATKTAEPAVIIAGLTVACRLWRTSGTEAKFIPHPSTWLNAERWADETPRTIQPAVNAEPSWMRRGPEMKPGDFDE